MDDRASLIERAAELLRSGNQKPGPPYAEAPEPIVASSTPSAPRSLARTVTLDRRHLAQSGIIMPWTTSARSVEEFRIIKRQIMFLWQSPEYASLEDGRSRSIMITSSRPREGKTFISINLALAFAAEENLVTVLIDADAVRADTARILNIPSEPGLMGLLSKKLQLDDVLIQTDLPSLVILPPGAPGPEVPELLSGEGPAALLAEIAKRYPRYVIVIDTPPCLASTDPAAIAPIVSQALFVVEAGHTQRAEIESSLNMISGCRHISLVLNKAPARSSEHFGSYSYYYRPRESPGQVRED